MKFDIARAWKDEEYRHSLGEAELLSLPENPVGELELTDADLEAVYGGHHHFSGNCNSVECSGVCISFECNSVFCSFGCH